MKKAFLTLTALGMSAGMLTGCSMFQTDSNPTVEVVDGATQSPSAEATVMPSTQPSPTDSADAVDSEAPTEEQFASFVRENTTTLYVFGDGKIKDTALVTCEKLDAGADLKTIIDDLYTEVADISSNVEIDTEALANDLGVLAGAGVQAYCPQHVESLTNQLNEVDAP